MATTNAKYWAIFKMVRAMVYSVCTLLSIGFTAIYAVLLVRGWTSYTGEQRTIVIVLVTIDALSSIMLYLMLIFRFRLWLDGIRIALLLFFQVGGTVAIALFNQNFPCDNLGSVSTCKTVETVAIYGSWSLSGLLLLFAFYLAVMSYVPEPKRRPNPEALLALTLANNSEKREKRVSTSSFGSATSAYSQKSYIGPLQATPMQKPQVRGVPAPRSENGSITPYNYIPSFPQSPGRAVRTPSIASTARTPGPYNNNYYRPGTPGSMRSMAPSIVSNIRASTRQRYYNSSGIPAPQPRSAEQLQTPMLVNQQSFGGSVSRQGTTRSVMSSQSQYVPRQRQPAYLSPPPGLGSVGNGLNFPQPPNHSRGPAYPARVTSPLASPITPVNMVSDQRTMAMQMREALMMRTPSPGARSLNSPTSPDSVHTQVSRNNSASFVPRSPSPQHGSFSNLPTTPLSAVLPAHPVLPSPAQAKYELQDVPRRGTTPDFRVNERMREGQYRTGSAPPGDWADADNNRMGPVDYWRQQATEMRGLGGRLA